MSKSTSSGDSLTIKNIEMAANMPYNPPRNELVAHNQEMAKRMAYLYPGYKILLSKHLPTTEVTSNE